MRKSEHAAMCQQAVQAVELSKQAEKGETPEPKVKELKPPKEPKAPKEAKESKKSDVAEVPVDSYRKSELIRKIMCITVVDKYRDKLDAHMPKFCADTTPQKLRKYDLPALEDLFNKIEKAIFYTGSDDFGVSLFFGGFGFLESATNRRMPHTKPLRGLTDELREDDEIRDLVQFLSIKYAPTFVVNPESRLLQKVGTKVFTRYHVNKAEMKALKKVGDASDKPKKQRDSEPVENPENVLKTDLEISSEPENDLKTDLENQNDTTPSFFLAE